MKRLNRNRLFAGLLALIAVVSIFPARAFAVAGTVSLTPPGGTVILGNEITVEVRGNVPDPGLWGGGATIVVNYDASKLQLTDRNDSGGAFRGANSRVWDGTGSGTVRYVAYYAINAPGVNGSKIISMKFKAIATGSVVMSFGSSTNVNNGPTSGTSQTFTIIPNVCPAGQTGTPPNCVTPPPPTPTPTPAPRPTTPTNPSRPSPTPTPSASPQPSVTPAPTQEETPEPTTNSDGGLKIENIKSVTTRQRNSVTWTLNRDGITPTLTYGTSKNAATTKATVEQQDDGSYEAELPALKAGTLYHFTIKAASSDSLQGATYNGTFTTRGYPVQLTVQQNGVLAPGAKVTIGSRTFTANKNAIITAELGDGAFTASITPVGATAAYSAKFTVAKKQANASGSIELQSFVLNAAIDGSGNDDNDNLLLAIAGLVAVLLGIGGALWFFLAKRRQQETSENGSVDEDLLIANYGTALETYRTNNNGNTPAPNIEAATYATPASISEQNNYSTETTPTLPQEASIAPQQPDYETAPEQQAPAQAPMESFSPESLPLPPLQPEGDAAQQTDPTSQTPMEYPVDEQISPELTAIESMPVAESEEPSAIYDAATGELDIIHRQTPGNQVPTTTEQTLPDTDDTDLSIAHAPPAQSTPPTGGQS